MRLRIDVPLMRTMCPALRAVEDLDKQDRFHSRNLCGVRPAGVIAPAAEREARLSRQRTTS
jgi:hypothetical protein